MRLPVHMYVMAGRTLRLYAVARKNQAPGQTFPPAAIFVLVSVARFGRHLVHFELNYSVTFVLKVGGYFIIFRPISTFLRRRTITRVRMCGEALFRKLEIYVL